MGRLRIPIRDSRHHLQVMGENLTDMRIRTATPGDTETLVELMTCFYREASFGLQRDDARSAFEELLKTPAAGRIWICEQASEAIGYIVLTLGFSMEYGGRDGFVEDLFVQPPYRGRGAGKRLLETLIGESTRLGVRALHLEVGRDNQRARRLYRARGFKDNDRCLLTMQLDDAIHRSNERPPQAGSKYTVADDSADREPNRQ